MSEYAARIQRGGSGRRSGFIVVVVVAAAAAAVAVSLGRVGNSGGESFSIEKILW